MGLADGCLSASVYELESLQSFQAPKGVVNSPCYFRIIWLNNMSTLRIVQSS